MLFGIYPGGATGDDAGGLATGAPDSPERISALLDELQGTGGPFVVRAYTAFKDNAFKDTGETPTTPADAARYAVRGRRLDLVAQYQSATGDVAGYCDFVRALVERHGAVTAMLQVTEEPNVTDNPVLDGHYPGVRDAITAGVVAAKSRARELGHDLAVGFNTTPLFGPAASFLTDLTAGAPAFADALDYVGLDFFPDVFRPVAGDLAEGVAGLLSHHRELLRAAGLGHVPLHVTEHGWPTGPDRSPRRQAEVVQAVVRVVAENADRLGITGYTHFALRDADSANPGLFHNFGLTTDDYTPKPAFGAYRALIAELGG
ncbi:hypothetical protein [Saccharothrix texasensis]|uniref:Uncharacterized protein n=1 Tax=Saccharothrix texasensis TaxID=103734 RepID=A0A3N1H8C0_9PSEU|nr:hypothetical protein [Saccharothrix texasensis]ROP38708.1 hypothetical protein EDD40_4071 [Saccharothrix texasensis]